MKIKIIIAFLTTVFAIGLNGQVSDIGKFLAAGPEDAEKLMQGYLAPYFNAFGASLTGGWYNTAKPHQLGGFDITATFNTAIVPKMDRSFDIAELGLESLVLNDPNDNISPTIAGENSDGPQLDYNFPDPIPNQSAFNMPKGTGFPYIPSPMLQAGVGLIKDTEINGRYMPTYSYKESNVGMWGLGFKHGLKQWIPFIKRVPVLHLTVQYGYTKMNASLGINVSPSDIGASDGTSSADWENQKMEFTTQSHTGNLIISANLPVVCFYGSIGFANTKSNLSLIGDYPVLDPTASLTSGPVVTDDSFLTNPVSIEVINSDGSTTKPRFNAGMRFKFAVITLHGDYTYANYSMVTVGIGISFR